MSQNNYNTVHGSIDRALLDLSRRAEHAVRCCYSKCGHSVERTPASPYRFPFKKTISRILRTHLLPYILIAILCGATFVGTVQADTTTHFPSSANVLTGSIVSGDMTSLVNADTNYYIVRSASSATTTTPYNPIAYNLLGSTSLVSGAVSDLASNNGVYMTLRSYVSQTSTTSLSRAFIGYRSNTGASTLSSPKTRSWNGLAWDGTETELASAGSPVRWVRTAYSPLMARYYEKIIVTLSDDGNLDAYVWTGSSWSVTNNLGFVGTTANAYRPFDVAYEKTSGNALLVYGVSSIDSNNDLAYRVWNGFSWSAESYINDSGHGTDVQYYWVDLASKPTSGANEIALVALEGTTTDGSVRAWIWNGNSWGSELSLETKTIKPVEDVGVAYESLSGNAMFAWGSNLEPRYDSRRWLGSSWEGSERVVTSSISGSPSWLTLKSDPASDRIMFLTVDSASDSVRPAVVTLKTTSSQTITVTDGTVSKTSSPITVSVGALNHIVVSPDSATVTAGGTETCRTGPTYSAN